MMDMYKRLAASYDKCFENDYCSAVEKKFYEDLFNRYHVNSVLDCACGTGRHLFMFYAMGMDVCGSDRSQSMLQIAKEKLSAEALSISVKQCDFRYLEQHRKRFDAVVCLTSALPHLLYEKDIMLSFHSMYSCLNEGGILVITQGITHQTLMSQPIEVIRNDIDFTRLFVKQQTNGNLSIQIVDLIHSAERTEEHQYELLYKIILDDEYRELLKNTGFSSVEVFGNYDMSVYDKNSNRLIVIARV